MTCGRGAAIVFEPFCKADTYRLAGGSFCLRGRTFALGIES